VNRLRVVVLALTGVLPLSAHSAEITRIASSFEDTHPFGMFIDVGFERTQQKELISQELYTDGTVKEVPQLRYTSVDTRLNLDLHLGLWKDVEFRYGLPIVFQHDEFYGLANGTSSTTSTFLASPNNCVTAGGQLVDPNCPTTGAGSVAYGPFSTGSNANAVSYRNGVGNMRFGLAWAPYNQAKDDTKPTWIVGLDYEAPTAQKLDPSVPTSEVTRGSLGDRTHKYSFYTSFSRRIGAADPYFMARITLPLHGPFWYSNCDNASASNMAKPDNCNNTTDWPRANTGIAIPVTAGVVFGSEFNAYEELEKHQKVGVDLRGVIDYFGPGRYYNELSALSGKLMYTQDYLRFGGTVGLTAYASDYLRLQAGATLLYSTPHLLSAESLGRDLNNDGKVNFDSNPREVNPNFDFRTDAPSRHVIASEIFTFQVNVTASLIF